MKVYIKSKFTRHSIYSFVFMFVLPFCVGVFYMFRILSDLLNGNVESIADVLLSLFFISLFLLVIKYLKQIRYIIIRDNKLKYYSLFVPFGKTLHFDNYIGKIILTERGSGGSYKVVFLVDKNNRTVFKIMGLHYKRFGEIINAIPLETINFTPTTKQYFKLVYFERIRIKQEEVSPDENIRTNKILVIFQIISVIGLALFVVGSIIKIIMKL